MKTTILAVTLLCAFLSLNVNASGNTEVNINFANLLTGAYPAPSPTPYPTPYPTPSPTPSPAAGFVYAGTNEATTNRVAVYKREENGYLREIGRPSTGGAGIGGAVDPLGSQGSLIRSPDSKYILYVNAGSNSISVLRREADGTLTVRSVTSSYPSANSSTPASLTAWGNYVYVLNSGSLTSPSGVSSISGFRADWTTGTLTYLTGSTRSFAGNFGQVSFTPNGNFLILPGKGLNLFLSFAVDANGIPSADPVTSSTPAGRVPFSLEYDKYGNALVSLAFGGVGSYSIDGQGRLTTIQELNTSSAASCWIVRHPSSDVFYVVNAGKPSIGAFRSSANGQFTRIAGVTMLSATNVDDDTVIFRAGSIPLDAAVTDDNQYFYVLLGGSGRVASFFIRPLTGLLVPRGEFEFQPPGYNGINGIAAF